MRRSTGVAVLLFAGTVLAAQISAASPPAGQPFEALQVQIDDLQAQIDALGGASTASISVGSQMVDRDFDLECPGNALVSGAIVLLGDGTVKRIDTAPLSFTVPDAAFGELASLTTASWADVEGFAGVEFFPADCFGAGEPSLPTSFENLNACAVAVDGTLACVNGIVCSGDCDFFGLSSGFAGKPWTFEGDVLP